MPPAESDFAAAGSGAEAVFRAKWARLAPEHKLVIRALIDQGGEGVRDNSLIRSVRAYIKDKDAAARAFLTATGVFESTDLVLIEAADPAHHRLSINKRWLGRIVRELAIERAAQLPIHRGNA